ncbi:MAG TPA: prolyl oligopeptidase family serine peptidase [Streptosporangiaceae bacterium]|nr:prolyl oligopeptidase family serine peptidase [Streptosporangiaceae bacterium]
MTDSFPRQQARTRRFSLGAPRSFQVSPDGGTVAFLRSRGGTDPVTCLWALDVATGTERLVADPVQLAGFGAEDDEREKARRERARELARGVVGFATDDAFAVAAFTLAGRVYLARLGAASAAGGDGRGAVRELATQIPAADPRPDPSGARVAYACAGALRVIDIATGEDRAVAGPAGDPLVTFGVAEFIAAEEMRRTRGYWWAPDGSALLAARVDENPVQRWHIADPSRPEAPAREVRYPAAGTANADVTAVIAGLDGQLTPVTWDTAALPYLVTASWGGPDGAATPLLVVQSRDQRTLVLLAADPATGKTRIVRADTDPHWVDIVPGVPAWTAGGKIAWAADSEGTRRVLVATPAEHEAGTAEPVTPAGLHVRQVLDTDGDDVLFTASAADPAQAGLWLAGPGGVTELTPGTGLHTGRRAGGTTVVASRRLDAAGVTVTVRRPGAPQTTIASLAEQPLLPDVTPVLSYGGPRRLRTAILLPSWHQPGSGKLPVLCDPYGGPHHQEVLAARDAYSESQWLADQGFAVVVADGRGTPGRGPAWERAVAGDLATPALEDQVEALHAAAEECADLDLSRVGIRGWSFGGFLAALAVLRRPDVFHAAVAGAPVTEWRLYDTHYTERYLGDPAASPLAYESSSLTSQAARLSRPLMIIHGMADDNVAVAHSLRLSAALLAAGRPHEVLPLTGVTHLPAQEEVAESLLLLQVGFLRRALGAGPSAGSGTSAATGHAGTDSAL